MSSNRLIYDKCAYDRKLKESTSPLDYNLYGGKFENTAKCRIEFGTVGGNGVSIHSGNLVDLESELRGQTRLNSLCPSTRYDPRRQPALRLNHQPSCQMQYYPQVPSAPSAYSSSSCKFSSWN